MNTASKNESISVEAQPSSLPTLTGKLLPWTRGRSLSAGCVAKFLPAESEHGTVWIPGQMFQVRAGEFVRTVSVERFIAAKEIPADRVPVYAGRGRHELVYTKARTLPACVVVRVIRAVLA